MPLETTAPQPPCAGIVGIDGFSLCPALRVEAHDGKLLEHLCRYNTWPALSDEPVRLDAAGQVESELKTIHR